MMVLRMLSFTSGVTKEQDYRFYLDCLGDAAERHGVAIHAYVLMTNHVHLLVTPEVKDNIGKTLQSLGRRYVHISITATVARVPYGRAVTGRR